MKASIRLAIVAIAGFGLSAEASERGLSKGTPDLKSAGPIAFGPDGLLLIGDTKGAAIFAVETGDHPSKSASGTFKVDGLDEKVAALLGTTPQQILINDLAVNPASGKAYLSVSRGKGNDATPVIVRVDRSGNVERVGMEDVAFAKADLPQAPAPGSTPGQGGRPAMDRRSESITDLAFVDGKVFVAGLSNEEFSSRLLSIPFPFSPKSEGTSVEIYHGAHGRFETKSPVRTFAPYTIKGEPYIMAAYTCTPLVKVPVNALKPGSHFKATTVAELGNHNRPLDMIVYNKDGKDYLLVANSARGVMKVTTEGVDTAASITSPVKETAGLPYQTIDGIKNVMQLDSLDSGNALVLVQDKAGAMTLEAIALP